MLQNSTLSDLYDYHHRVCHHAVTEGKQPRLGTWGIMILSKFKLIQVYSGYQLVFVWFFKMFYHVLLLQNLKAKNQALQASITPRWSTGSQWEDFLSTVSSWLFMRWVLQWSYSVNRWMLPPLFPWQQHEHWKPGCLTSGGRHCWHDYMDYINCDHERTTYIIHYTYRYIKSTDVDIYKNQILCLSCLCISPNLCTCIKTYYQVFLSSVFYF